MSTNKFASVNNMILSGRTLLAMFVFAIGSFNPAVFAKGPSLLLISVDGFRPDYITKADEHGLKIPTLRKFVKEGTYATGVRGVLPSSTYPSHTTLVTGVYPVKHGIDENHPFDPTFSNPNAWNWFTEDIRVPTIWQAAAKAGVVVGSISWPVTVGAEGIRYNLPEFNGTRTPDDLKMVRALASAELMDELEKNAGPYLMDVNNALPRDWSRTRYAVEMIRRKKIGFLTLHLAATDHLQHRTGPFSKAVLEAVKETDKMVSILIDALRAQDPRGIVCIVSDHGFARVEKSFKLHQAFVSEGLITLKGEGETLDSAKVKSWVAMASSSGGSACIVMKNPQDKEACAKVKTLLEKLAADPQNGIAKILDRTAIAKLGGTTDAEFWVDMKPGFSITGGLKEPLVSEVSPRGSHGYSPDHPEMNSSFFILGAGIREGVDLGIIDMRNIAPTLAKAMGTSFPSADLPPLSIFEKKK